MGGGLEQLKGVGKVRLQTLNDAGIEDVQGLLGRFPKEYIFFLDACKISDVQVGQRCLLRAKIQSARPVFARGLKMFTAKLTDGHDTIEAVWFNQPYLAKQLEIGQGMFFYGLVSANKGKRQLVSPMRFPLHQTGVQPIYPPLAGIPSKTFGQMVQNALEHSVFEEYMPKALLLEHELPSVRDTYLALHFPEDKQALFRALSRLAFEDLLLFQMAIAKNARQAVGISLAASTELVQPFLDSLGFSLTGAQKRVLDEIFADMRGAVPMARLVEGDVGSGKTALAFAALFACVQNGMQGAMMAPTEVLASQHYEKAKEQLGPLGVRVGFLTGSITQKERKEVYEGLKNGEIQLVIGTHALITERVEYKNLALIVTDEQHRFGVRQRTSLEQKGLHPHVLVMSATPIPRTMALVLYGDMDLSIVDELPPGRQEIITRLVPEEKRKDMYGFIEQAVAQGSQVYVICPLVEETASMDAANAVETCQTMQSLLKNIKIELLHGRMKGQEKQALLQRFARGETDVLVSTTVIEVGVNVPNATIMVVENAERFGLAQLHQLRGRVGRGEKQSWCFLMAQSTQKLKIMTQTNDGFLIAQKDLELRGPGEFMGSRQHGKFDQRLMELAGDGRLLKSVKEAAQDILSHPNDEENQRFLAYAMEQARRRGYEIARN